MPSVIFPGPEGRLEGRGLVRAQGHGQRRAANGLLRARHDGQVDHGQAERLAAGHGPVHGAVKLLHQRAVVAQAGEGEAAAAGGSGTAGEAPGDDSGPVDADFEVVDDESK